MRALPELQSSLVTAILGPEPPCDRATPWPASEAAVGIHRRNVLNGLAELLAETFPVVRQLVGAPFFRHVAHEFVRASPPRSPVLLEYGAKFSAFLAGFPPAAGVVYLGDVAALEWARREAYHAAEAPPLRAEALAALPPECMADLRLGLHPSARLLASPYPIDAIWTAHQQADDAEAASLPEGGAQLLVIRPDAEVEMRALSAPQFAFLSRLNGGASVHDARLAAGSEFDLAPALCALLTNRVFSTCSLGGET